MKNLILFRHGKSSWDEPINDIERSLSSRGINDVRLVSNKAKNHLPESFLIWSSIAKRATDTAIIFAENISYPIENIVFKKELYTFDVDSLEQIIKSCPNHNDNVILFGHNEAITNFVNRFGDNFIDNVPTSGFVSIQFDTNNWEIIDKGKIIETIFPKNLK